MLWGDCMRTNLCGGSILECLADSESANWYPNAAQQRHHRVFHTGNVWGLMRLFKLELEFGKFPIHAWY